MKVQISTMIVDDKSQYAKSIEEVIILRNSESSLVEYVPRRFDARTHFEDARQYIKGCIIDRVSIDLCFCDYHLDGGNGIELFQLFEGSKLKPFRVLHSNTTKRFTEHSEEFLKGYYDVFNSSKNDEKLIERLLEYEEQIVKLKLYGNSNYWGAYYKNLTDFQRKKSQQYKMYDLHDLMYVNTQDDMHIIVTRSYSEENNSIQIVKNKPTGPDYRIQNFIDAEENFRYLRLNQSVLVNLLWVSKIDTLQNEVHFIMPDSKTHILKLKNSKSKFVPINFNFDSISNSLHRYFQ